MQMSSESKKFFFNFKRNKKHPSQHLLVQSQQWKHQNSVRNLFEVNNNRTGVFIVDLEELKLAGKSKYRRNSKPC